MPFDNKRTFLLGFPVLVLLPSTTAMATELEGLELSLSFNDASGQLVSDGSGNGHDGYLGTSSGPDIRDPGWGILGECDGYLEFEHEFVSVPNHVALEPSEVTVEAWVNADSSPGIHRYIVAKGAQNCNFASYALYSSTVGGLEFYIADGSTFITSPDAGTGVWDGAWHHVAGTFDGSTVRLYVDGMEIGNGTPTTTSIAYGFNQDNDLLVGAFGGTCWLPFNGDIDQVRVWSRVLTADELAQNSLVCEVSNDGDGDGVPDEEDLCPGVDDELFAGSLGDPEGFDLEISVDGDDVVLSWPPALELATGLVEVWRATDIDDLPGLWGPCYLPPGPTAQLLFAGEASSHVDLAAADRWSESPNYFYRVLGDGAEPNSRVVAKVTTATAPGYTKFGLCMVDGVEVASDMQQRFGDSVLSVHVWDEVGQSWRSWWSATGTGPFGDFALPFGGVVSVGFDDTVLPFHSLVGAVPTDQVPLAPAPGLNILTWPLVTGGFEPSASAYLDTQDTYQGVGYWDPQTQSATWYSGPGDQDFTLEACNPYYFDAWLPLEPGLPSAWWRLNEAAGPTALDSAAGGNHGTYGGNPTPTLGVYGNALSFDGVGDYIEVPDASELNVGEGDLSISYYIRTSSLQLDVVVDKRVEVSGPVRGYVAYLFGGSPSLQLANGAGWSNWSSTASVNDDQWHHVVITVDRDDLAGGHFYVDGVEAGSFNPTGRQGDLDTTMPLRVGRRSDSPSPGWLDGELDEVKLYKSIIE